MLLVGSFGGAVHGLGDTLAVFRHFWAISLSVSSLLLLRGHVGVALLGVLVVVLGMFPVGAGYFHRAVDIGGGYSLYQKNLLFKGQNQSGIIADILETAPDFITLQEVSRVNRGVFESLVQTYPSSLFCPFTGVGGVAVLSNWPAVLGTATCAGDQGMAAIQLVMPAGPFWLVAVHLHWPFPYNQRSHVARLLSEIYTLDGPVILAGDFNMVPWSHTMRQLENATGSQRAGRVVQTYRRADTPLQLAIDYILVPGGTGNLSTRSRLGSDHFGLLLRFDL